MNTSEIKSSDSRRVTMGLLFAAAFAIAMFFNMSAASAQEATGNSQTTSTSGSGDAAAETGDADGSGNSSDTAAAQSGGGSGSQGVNITNNGTASANTGGNTVEGNSIDNSQTADQSPAENAVNVQTASNTADGSASLVTGNASATGNTASTSVTQHAEGDGVVNQTANILNEGHADANTGDNLVAGNLVVNDLAVDQSVDAAGDVTAAQVNVQTVANTLSGSADVVTGDASSSGNNSSTSVDQWASANGSGPNGPATVNQAANVTNIGTATANTGENVVSGNDIFNSLLADQSVLARAPPVVIGGIALDITSTPVNVQTVSNVADGTASLVTGDASASGNTADTAISQEACACGDANITQTANVNNIGTADANSGRNDVAGNFVTNDLFADQSLDLGLGLVVIGTVDVSATVDNVNVQTVDNALAGSADVVTGDADAWGNDSSTSISQLASGEGSVNVVQDSTVNNIGTANANSGENVVSGNDLLNSLVGDQSTNLALGVVVGAAAVDVSAANVNVQTAANALAGDASLVTGDASSTGNVSDTSISQEVCAEGSGFIGQHATVNNVGNSTANTGRNDVAGNAVVNDLFGDQSINIDALVIVGAATADITANRVNVQTAANALDGSAAVATGDASSTANQASTAVAQEANVEGTFDFDTGVTINNTGTADANSGDNAAAGNDLVNTLNVDQSINVSGLVIVGLAAADISASNVNVQTAVNDAVGTADVATGDAEAVGNVSSVSVSQSIGDTDKECDCKGAAEEKEKEEHAAPAGVGGGQLPVTGFALGGLAFFGLILIALGGLVRRKATKASA